jgi:hypothetical protein
MQNASWIDQLGFVVKVMVISLLLAIAFKTVAPQLPIPATSLMSLVIVLTPAILMGAILTWQLWTANDADPTHSRSD